MRIFFLLGILMLNSFGAMSSQTVDLPFELTTTENESVSVYPSEALRAFRESLSHKAFESADVNADGTVTFRRPRFLFNGEEFQIEANSHACKHFNMQEVVGHDSEKLLSGPFVAFDSTGVVQELIPASKDLTLNRLVIKDWLLCRSYPRPEESTSG